MHLKYIMALTLITITGMSVFSMAGVNRAYPDRSVEELKLMTGPELAGDARLACMHSSYNRYKQNFNYDEVQHAQRYLERIGFVLRGRNHGKMPAWFDQLMKASKEERNDVACIDAATAGGWKK